MGMSGYVSKPVNRSALLLEMSRVLADRKPSGVDRDAESPQRASLPSQQQRTETTPDEIDLSDILAEIEGAVS
jgi:hypothetical protein